MKDTWPVRIATVILGLVVLLAVGGAILLELNDKDLPDVLTVLGGAAIGSLGTLFAVGRASSPDE